MGSPTKSIVVAPRLRLVPGLMLAVGVALGGCSGDGVTSEGLGAQTIAANPLPPATQPAGPAVVLASGGPAAPLNAAAGGGVAGEVAYVLGPGDKVRILVFNEAEISREYEVDSAGKVTLPLIGAVQASGKTPVDLQESIRKSLAQGYIRDPKVSIEVLSYRPFYIIGEVSKSGEYPYKNGMNVVSAVAVAGGYTYRANTGTVFVRRANEQTERSYDANGRIPVGPGDIVRIPERYF